MICEKATRAYPGGRRGTHVGFAAHRQARETACEDCTLAQKQYLADYGQANKDRIAAYNRDRRDNRQVIVDRLKSVPCADCGQTFPPVCMDFDHLGGKDFNIGSASTRSLETVLAEIAKCEVVCANCHRIRTADRLVRKHPKKVSL